MQRVMQRKVIAKGETITYTLSVKNVKNINLRVHTDGNVFVSAPRYIPLERVDSYVTMQVDFILRAQNSFQQQAEHDAMPMEYVTGDTVPYLGKRVLLEVKQGKKNEVLWGTDKIELILANRENATKRAKIFRQAFLCQQEDMLTEIFQKIYEKTREKGIPKPALRFRTMKTRWGSCQPATATITLNRQLITKPIEFIEYVAVHELIHLLVADHSNHFYEEVGTILPDWKERRRMGIHSVEDMIATDEEDNL